jgi:tetratricopeptide (TPR) repeat protein
MEVEMYRLAAVGLLAILGLALPCSSYALQLDRFPSEGHETLKIDGTVYYEGTNLPAANVMIELRDSQGASVAPMMTDQSGGFRFGGLNAGTYSIAIHADGCQPVNMLVDLSYNSERGVKIYLKPLPSKAAPNESISAHEYTMPPKARELMTSGKKKLYDDKNAAAALADFQAADAAAPEFYEPKYQIGMAYMTLGQRDDAEKSFRSAIDLSGDKSADAEVGLGWLLLDEGNYAGGERAIRRGIDLAPSLWLGYYELGRLQMNQNLFADAEKSAERARALEPSALIVYRLLSNIHMQQKNYTALLDDLDAYIKLDPKSIMGIHAQQLRLQVEARVAKEKSDTEANSKP